MKNKFVSSLSLIICTKFGCSRIISCYVNLKFKGSESEEKDKITENTVAERSKITKKYGITLVLKKYCNTFRNRWQEGRWFVSKQYFVFKPAYESSMTTISILVFH